LFTYCQFFAIFCNRPIVIRIRISFPEIAYVKYTPMPCPIYKCMVNVVVSLPFRKGAGGCATISCSKRTVLYKVIWAYHNFPKGIFKI
jgi:hypothetical protein